MSSSRKPEIQKDFSKLTKIRDVYTNVSIYVPAKIKWFATFFDKQWSTILTHVYFIML